MYHTTGFSRDEVIDLCVLINSAGRGPGSLKWPPILGLFKSVAATLTYMRHNRRQSEISEMITPFKKPAGGELLSWQKEFNTLWGARTVPVAVTWAFRQLARIR
jgi:hypothetical protein